MRTSAAVIVLGLACAAPLAAQAPLSAIDWLSDSIAEAPLPGPAQPDMPRSAASPSVTTLPLEAPLPDAVGLISSAEAGFSADFWGNSSEDEIARRLRAMPPDLLPGARALLKRLLLTELDPPRDASGDTTLLLARVDKLLSLGALDEADALLGLAGPASAELFRRRLDVALLKGTEGAACDELIQDPRISPTYPARIFCLARMGDWHTAAVTLDTANALGLLTEDEDSLLARYIHPELAEELPPLGPPGRPSPLVFRLYEAVGEPLPTGGLALAFAHADLRETVGWKARIEAAERLARIGAVDANLLLGLYLERRPSASGGVWERARAIQALDAALEEDDKDAIGAALAAADREMAAAGLERPFARAFAARLAETDLVPASRPLAARLALLAGEPAPARTLAAYGDDPFLLALATGAEPPPDMSSALRQAIRSALVSRQPPSRFAFHLGENRRGEALLLALERLSQESLGNTDDVADAIGVLRHLGFEPEARQIAIEALLSGTTS